MRLVLRAHPNHDGKKKVDLFQWKTFYSKLKMDCQKQANGMQQWNSVVLVLPRVGHSNKREKQSWLPGMETEKECAHRPRVKESIQFSKITKMSVAQKPQQATHRTNIHQRRERQILSHFIQHTALFQELGNSFRNVKLVLILVSWFRPQKNCPATKVVVFIGLQSTGVEFGLLNFADCCSYASFARILHEGHF